MSGSYEISIDPARELLRIRFVGFFREADLAFYTETKSEALARLGTRPNAHVTLCDFSDCIPQSQNVLDLFKDTLGDPAARSRRLAVVVTGALGQFQAMRTVTRSDAAFFKTVADAERWLFDDSDDGDPMMAGALPAMTSLPAAPRRSRG